MQFFHEIKKDQTINMPWRYMDRCMSACFSLQILFGVPYLFISALHPHAQPQIIIQLILKLTQQRRSGEQPSHSHARKWRASSTCRPPPMCVQPPSLLFPFTAKPISSCPIGVDSHSLQILLSHAENIFISEGENYKNMQNPGFKFVMMIIIIIIWI